MDELKALKKLKKGDEAALVWFMDRYAPYVRSILAAKGERSDRTRRWQLLRRERSRRGWGR